MLGESNGCSVHRRVGAGGDKGILVGKNAFELVLIVYGEIVMADSKIT